MTESVFSQSWYRVADLTPRIRGHIRISRHRYRKQIWYVLQDAVKARYHRFTPAAYYVIGLMDGVRTVDAIWDAANEEFGDDAPTQDEMIRLLGELHATDALQCDVPPDSEEVFRRYERDRLSQLKKRLLNPLALRIPLFDPDRLLTRLAPALRLLFSRFALCVWTIVVGCGAIFAAAYWTDLTHNLSDRVLSTNNLLLLLLVFPLVKLCHEFGHGLATKTWGGEVHEAGISLLVLAPVPYVDASAASAFPEKRKRIAVSAAGIMVELFLASLALFAWLNIESGLVSALLFNVMLVGGVSTLFFNGNPLLRFDAYYILADAIEIPNLGARAQQYLGYLCLRYLFRVEQVESPVTARGEAKWFLCYGIAAFFYRLFVTFFIILFVASKFLLVGLLLAGFALLTQIVLPLARQIGFLLTSPLFGPRRLHALGLSSAIITIVTALVFYLPVPYWTRAEGVVWLPERSQVRVGSDGTVAAFLAEPAGAVAPGVPLVALDDPFLDAELAVLEARLLEANANYDALAKRDRVAAELVAEERDTIRAERDRVRERAANLVVRSPGAGEFIVPDPVNLPGRFVHKGELIGYVAARPDASVRVVVTQSDILLIRQRTLRVEMNLASRPQETLSAVIRREVPAAKYLLPSRALGAPGGGRIAVDPADSAGTRALEKVFQFDLAFADGAPPAYFGERVHVRFAHGEVPLGRQWFWMGRQLLLRHFGV